MKKSQLKKMIREEIEQNVVQKTSHSPIKNIRKEIDYMLKARPLLQIGFKQLNTSNEIYEYLQTMIEMLPLEVRNSEQFKVAFRKLYPIVTADNSK